MVKGVTRKEIGPRTSGGLGIIDTSISSQQLGELFQTLEDIVVEVRLGHRSYEELIWNAEAEVLVNRVSVALHGLEVPLAERKTNSLYGIGKFSIVAKTNKIRS